MTIAKKLNPELWEKAKIEACRQAKLCAHSARKMQWATRYYKKKGGKYRGKKSSKNSLTKWSKQKWKTKSGKKSEGKRRYLPAKAWDNLTPAEIRAINSSKARATKRKKQYSRMPKQIVKKIKPFRM